MKFTNNYAILQNKVIVNAKKKPQTGVLVKRSYNKVYHFDEINQFSEREIPEQSVSPGSDPKLYASCDVISIIQKT
jgi:hypothetical protein